HPGRVGRGRHAGGAGRARRRVPHRTDLPLPIALMVGLALKKVPPFLSIFVTAVFTGVLASFIQPDAVTAFVGKPDQGAVLTGIEAVFKAMANGFVSVSGNDKIDTLFTGGGMASMLTTVWLILGALSFAAIMEDAGMLDRLIAPVVAR